MECVQGIVAGMHSGQVHQLTICLLHGRADGLVVGGQTLHKTGEGALSPWNGTQNQCAAVDLCVGIGLPKTGEQLLVFPEEPFWRHIKIGVVEPGIEKDVVWRDAIDGKLCNSTRGKSAHGARSGDGIAGDGEIGKKPSLEGTDHLHPPGIFHCMYTCGSAQIRGVMGSAPGRVSLKGTD